MITSKSRFPTFENSFQEISKVRYILDPMGFQSNLWSMAGDPDTFAHVEFFKEIAAQPEVQKIWSDAGQDCSRLAELSRAALRDFNAQPPALVSYCPPAALKAQAIGDLSRLTASMTLVLARNPVAQALRGCIGCHLAGIEGAPKIPFGNLNQMEKLIANRKGNPGDLGEIIWDRITRSPDSYNSMPLGGAPLSDESKRAVREWLELIPAREK